VYRITWKIIIKFLKRQSYLYKKNKDEDDGDNDSGVQSGSDDYI